MRGDKSVDDVGETIGNAHFESLVYHVFGSRTVAEIQRKVIKQRGRNAVSRILNAKNDRETITAWKSDLSRMLHVFNVRSVVSAQWSSLTPRLKTELAVNTHATISDIRHDIASTRTIVSDIQRNTLKTGTDGQHQWVSNTCPLSTAEQALTVA